MSKNRGEASKMSKKDQNLKNQGKTDQNNEKPSKMQKTC